MVQLLAKQVMIPADGIWCKDSCRLCGLPGVVLQVVSLIGLLSAARVWCVATVLLEPPAEFTVTHREQKF